MAARHHAVIAVSAAEYVGVACLHCYHVGEVRAMLIVTFALEAG